MDVLQYFSKNSTKENPDSKVNIDITIKDVVSEYNLIGMAIGVAIGIAGKDFAFSLVNDIVMPLVGNVVNTKFFEDYIFDGDKFASATITLAFVFLTVIFLLYVVLEPMIKPSIIEKREKQMNSYNSLQDLAESNREILEILRSGATSV